MNEWLIFMISPSESTVMRIRFIFLTLCCISLCQCERVKSIVAKATGITQLGSGGISEVQAEDHEAFLIGSSHLVVVKYYSEGSQECVALKPILEEVAHEYREFARVGKINLTKSPQTAARLGVMQVPEVRFYRDGKQLGGFSGVVDKNLIRNYFQQHTKDLVAAAKSGNPQAGGTAASQPNQGPSIQPMQKDWRPPGLTPK